MAKFTEFLNDDVGAVTIDWVALTSAILLLGIMVVYSIFNGGVISLVSSVNSTLVGVRTDVDVGPLTFGGPPPCPKTKKGIKCKK